MEDNSVPERTVLLHLISHRNLQALLFLIDSTSSNNIQFSLIVRIIQILVISDAELLVLAGGVSPELELQSMSASTTTFSHQSNTKRSARRMDDWTYSIALLSTILQIDIDSLTSDEFGS